jgi:hypothetical protein
MRDFKVSVCPAGPLKITEPYMYQLALVACQVASSRVKIRYADGDLGLLPAIEVSTLPPAQRCSSWTSWIVLENELPLSTSKIIPQIN